ncbi:hypothetical protein CARUB_v10018802mg [Capsella rubella]|uniref:TIR domain-containing protein n=2 Tax=Capsella rubella TaxID=81985 RepID=R0H831_9BRAS|nr:hypothetical protein CARUB_v10018802mg [Capsella rubella]
MRNAVSPFNVHQVFLNFRGEELRYNFVSHLTDAFERQGIKFFIDKNEQRGEDLKHIFVRIKESRIALAIFSPSYAESKWCMDELVMMNNLADHGKLRVIPIFYKVDADDVRKPTLDSEFGRNFQKLAEDFSKHQVKKWKKALKRICDKMGLPLEEKSSESDFVDEIVKGVKKLEDAIGLEEEEKPFSREKIKRKARNLNKRLRRYI